MNSTEKYVSEHQKVFSLPRSMRPSGTLKKGSGWSVRALLIHHIRTVKGSLIRYPRELFLARSLLTKTWAVRKTGREKRALVIGNGPSQGYLTKEKLNRFKSSGGETICINYWPLNRSLSEIVPRWMIFSDPVTFDEHLEKAQVLIDYLHQNPSICLAVPASLLSRVKSLSLSNEIYFFIDSELSIWKNINPLFPRGYTSMTLYKALAWAVYLGYSEVGVVGMDNTYPRNIYNDEENRLCNLETHSGENDYLLDFSTSYKNVAARLDDLVRLFFHLEFFQSNAIYNLDPYSLTDAFKKIELDAFIER